MITRKAFRTFSFLIARIAGRTAAKPFHTASFLILTFALLLSCTRTDEERIPYPTPMTGKEAPAFSEQGVYGEAYSLDHLKGAPAMILFGVSW